MRRPALYTADSAGNDTVKVLWTDPTPIVRGQYYNISINANVQNNSSGVLQGLDRWPAGRE